MGRYFHGFSKETFEFFMGIHFQNTKAFFEANRDKYQRYVLQPLKDLATDLIPVIEDIDPEIDTRPMVTKTISRINRDTRFSRDKSPYRDHMWIGYKKPGESNSECFGLYFEIFADWFHYGAGFYTLNKPRMDRLRQRILLYPEEFLQIVEDEKLLKEYKLMGEDYKRDLAPPELPEKLKPWYNKKYFYLEHSEPITRKVMTSELVDQLERAFPLLKPLYRFVEEIK